MAEKLSILLAGPGTGKTTKIDKELCKDKNANNILVVSFTNATINDLRAALPLKLNVDNCKTLHSLAYKIYKKFAVDPKYILSSTNAEKYMRELVQYNDDNFTWLSDQLNFLTFDSMIEEACKIVKLNPDHMQAFFKEIELFIVDEIQDFTAKEFELLIAIMSYIPEIILLGDDDQSIYSFKGSFPEQVINIYNKVPNKLKHEHICYRCPDDVVKHASLLINKNNNRIRKDWNPCNKAGEIIFSNFSNEDYMVGEITKKIKYISATEEHPKIMILYPYSKLISKLKNKLEEEKIEISFPEDLKKAEERDEYKIKSFDKDASHRNLYLLLYILFKIPRKNNQVILDDLRNTIFTKGVSFEIMLDWALKSEIKFFTDKEKALLENPVTKDALIKLYKLNENFFEEYNFIDTSVTLSQEKVDFMTIHKSKGLSADYVFVIGLIQEIMPSSRTTLPELEEERRKLFVAMTRAKKELYLISTQNLTGDYNRSRYFEGKRVKWNKDKTFQTTASQFISEMKLEHKKLNKE